MLNSILLIFSSWLVKDIASSSCGIDDSPVHHVYEGQANIATYPWLGFLFYPTDDILFTTAVVLVTRQAVLAAATEIDTLPKHDFRARALVVLGQNCSGKPIKIRDYTHHPDFAVSKSLSTLTIIQLDIDLVSDVVLRPICAPPSHFKNPIFFAMVLSKGCSDSKVMIYKMKYVSNEACQNYYRKSGLDLTSMWPTHTACASSLSGGKCIWRSGAILTIKLGSRWRLLGFGVYGPGCEAPARFLDYNQYHKWVHKSITLIGQPAITVLGDNHVIMRRTLSNVQRFGLCDYEEKVKEIFTDETSLVRNNASPVTRTYVYNLSLYTNVEYSCIIFRADNGPDGYSPSRKPVIHLRRWCAGPTGMCYGFGYLSIHFSIEVLFRDNMHFKLEVYGRETKILDPRKVLAYYNKPMPRPQIYRFKKLMTVLKETKYSIPSWYNG